MRPRFWLIIALTVALAAAGVMIFHTVGHAMRVRGATEPLRPWMSLPYIARSRHVPIDVLYQAAELPPNRRDHRPLARIARQQRRPVDELIARLEKAIAHAHGGGP